MLHQFGRQANIQLSPKNISGGYQMIIELYGCNRNYLESKEEICSIFKEVGDFLKSKLNSSTFYEYDDGVTGFLMLDKGQCSIRTWPRNNQASVDFYSYGTDDLQDVELLFVNGLRATKMEFIIVNRFEAITSSGLKKTQNFPSTPKMTKSGNDD